MHPLVPGVLAHDLRATARACRLVDDRVPGYVDLLRELFPHTGKAFLVGITGNPGAGKSTLVDRLVEAYRAEKKRVAVVAVDPTSPFSGGAILGDRIRMQRHFEDPEVFIRSIATRGALGGLSRSAIDVVRVLDAWGADVILIETVGVGQDELEIVKAASTVLVVMAPGMGDDVQAIKAGILECADVFAVNKADRDGADATVRDLELMLALGGEVISGGVHSRGHAAGSLDVAKTKIKHKEGAWIPPVVKCVATKKEGVAELVAKIESHRAWQATPQGQARHEERTKEQLRASLREALVEAAVTELGSAIDDMAIEVAHRTVDPYTASERLLERFRTRLGLVPNMWTWCLNDETSLCRHVVGPCRLRGTIVLRHRRDERGIPWRLRSSWERWIGWGAWGWELRGCGDWRRAGRICRNGFRRYSGRARRWWCGHVGWNSGVWRHWRPASGPLHAAVDTTELSADVR